ncbi:uncharacterized protein LOC125322343 [Corvus hawaiiensis]|uniref:uncharacterized protein LOC125322343 n=1 Tax=Corvus hawaiiensis TaxID=134902 RepID=UPI0020197275|nr:uncharacterized protein LOC125322343 [Corvus hawaiiensis]
MDPAPSARAIARSLQLVIILQLLPWPVSLWIVPQPAANVWSVLARTMGQDHICLSTAAAQNPMATCLVGIPLEREEFTSLLEKLKAAQALTTPASKATVAKPPVNLHCPRVPYRRRPPFSWHRRGKRNTDNPLEKWLPQLSRTSSEPQELDLLGSYPAHYCVQFQFGLSPDREAFKNIAPNRRDYGADKWCLAVSGVTTDNPHRSHPKGLPQGLFLICGDRAWAGIPSRLLGGPCTIGRLTLLTPNQTLVHDWERKRNRTSELAIQKRELSNLDQNCDSEVIHWARPKGVAISTLLPWVAAAKALGELGHMECWVVKQANLTSSALSDLLKDEQITRQATLQNRAAIDFLLLLHDHRCEEFEGLCCLNLSSRAENIHKTLDKMQAMVLQIQRETGDWLSSILNGWGLSGWTVSILRTGLLLFFVFLVTLVMFGLLRRLLFKLITSSPSPVDIGQAEALPESEHEPMAPELQWFGDLYPDSEYCPQPEFQSS